MIYFLFTQFWSFLSELVSEKVYSVTNTDIWLYLTAQCYTVLYNSRLTMQRHKVELNVFKLEKKTKKFTYHAPQIFPYELYKISICAIKASNTVNIENVFLKGISFSEWNTTTKHVAILSLIVFCLSTCPLFALWVINQ